MLGLGLSFAKQTAKVFSYIKDKLKAYYRFYDTQPDFLLDGSTSFDGTDDYIDTGSSFSGVFGDGTTDYGFTITCWVNKPEDSSGLYGVCGKTFSDLAIRLMSNGRVQVFLRDVGGSAYLQREPTSVIGSGWHHLAVTYDGSRTVDGIKIYGDAVAVSGGNGTSGTFNAHANTSNNFQIGNTNGGSYMTGDMACFGVWNRELSASEIESIRWRGAYSELKDTELTNLVSWYDLQGDVLDKQGSNDGTNNGATLNSDSYSGESPFKPRIQDKAHPKMAVQLADGSTSFDGTDDYIDLPMAFSNTNHTISGWFKLDNVSGNRTLFCGRDGNDDGIRVLLNTSQVLYQINVEDEASGTGSISANEWTHVACTYDGTTQSIYLNGSLSASQSISRTVSTTQTAKIGRTAYGTSDYMLGSLANIALYSSALTQTQIQELMFTEKYSGLSADLKTNLVSWYDLGSEDVTASQTELIADVSNRTFETGDGNSDWVNVTCDVFDDTNDLSIETSGSQYCKLDATYINGGNGFELNKRYRLTFDASGVSGLPRWGTAPTRTYAYISNGTNQTLEFTCLDADSGLFP